MEERFIKSILSCESWFKSQGFRTQANLPERLFKPRAINGIVPDVFAVKGYYCVAICIDDNANFCASGRNYNCLSNWLYAEQREFIIACPGDWPGASYTKLYSV